MISSMISSFFTQETSFHLYLLQGQMDTTQIHSTCSRKFYCALEKKMCFSWASKTNDQWLFVLKASKLRFINQVILTALLKLCSYIFNLTTLRGEEVAPHILHQLQLLLGQHLYILSSLLWICSLETLLLSFSSQSSRIFLINTLSLHLKLQLFFF